MKHTVITAICAALLVGAAFADPIHDAALDGDFDEVQWQLDAGVDVNEESSKGLAPLHYAASSGHNDIVELLIERGANVNATDSGKGATPLDYAHWRDHEEVIETLNAHNAQREHEKGGKGDGKGDGKGKSAFLSITNFGDGDIIVEFEFGILQTANSINGPWEDVDEVSPVTWTADQFSKFARLKFSK